MGAELVAGADEKYSGPNLYRLNSGPASGHIVEANAMVFSASWDWLMPVVEKINGLLDDGKLKGFDTDIFRSMQDWILSCKIDNAHKDAVTIIKWYNTQNLAQEKI